MKKSYLIIIVLAMLFAQNSFSQVLIKGFAGTPDASAMLDIQASDKGLLIPQIDLQNSTDATTISAPATSLLIWNTGATWGTASFYYNSGTSGSPVWATLGASGTIDGSGKVNHVSYWTDLNTLSFDDSQFYWDPTSNRLGIANASPTQALDVTGNIKMSGTRSKLFYKGDAVAHEGSIGIYSTGNGTNLILDPCNESGTTIANSVVNFGGFGAFVSSEVSLNVSNQFSVNTQTPGTYQAHIIAGTGNDGLKVTKDETIDGATDYSIYAHTSNNSNATTETTGLYALAESNSGDVYGVRGIAETQGTSTTHAVAGQLYTWNVSNNSLNAEGFLGHKSANGFIGSYGHVVNEDGLSVKTYGAYFYNEVTTANSSQNKYGIYSEVDAQSFSGNDGTESYGLYASAKNTEDVYGIVGEAFLTNWISNDILTGVQGKLSFGSNTYAEGYLSYYDSGNDFTGKSALVGVAGRVTDKETNNLKNSIGGFFGNEYNGSGNRESEAYGLYASSTGAGIVGSVNYGIYATASNAATNYAAKFDGDVVIGTNGTTVSNIIKVTVNKNIQDPAAAGVFTETFTVTNAVAGSSVIVSPGGLETNLLIVGAWVSAANTVMVKFYSADGAVTAARDYYITVIQ